MSVSLVGQKSARNEAVAVQAKAKALREAQRARLDGRHQYMLELVADRLQLELSTVEDYMLDGDQVQLTPHNKVMLTILCCYIQLNLFDELFRVNGRQALLFFYQDAETPISSNIFLINSTFNQQCFSCS